MLPDSPAPASASPITHDISGNVSSVRPQGLALHTSTPWLGLALGHGTLGNETLANTDVGNGEAGHEDVARETETPKIQVTNLGRSMASELQIALTEFMRPRAWSSLDFLAVAQGPGGFTGTRLGMVTARTLAQQLDIPLFSLSTLAAIAHHHWHHGSLDPQRTIALDMPAQRGQRFTALYRWEAGLPVALITDQVCSPEAWEATLAQQGTAPQVITVGEEAAQAVGSLWHMAQQGYLQGDRPSWQEAHPFYGQHPVTL
jgi:tRNA threonylcarbamoyl adenosine modification protein YeaZ